MKPGGESQGSLEATRRITPLLTKVTSIGTWNVRTMFETGKTCQVAAEMRSYGLDLLGISETRWTQSGQMRLNTGELLLYSGHEEENATHTQGVALMLSKVAQKALIGWEAHGPRLITASFQTKNKKIHMNIIQCYAPTNDSQETAKDQFYMRLQSVMEKFKERDINVIMGDFNAKIGNDNTGYAEVMGQHRLGDMNENGERFADWCALNNMVIGGSVFPHKKIHKATWSSPDHVTENQIDHFCINKKFRRSMEDVRVKRGADVASDHHLLVARLKLKLKRNIRATSTIRWKYNTGFLKDTQIKEEFGITLSNKFQALEALTEEADTLESKWMTIKETVTATCQEVLGPKKPQHKEWISAESVRKIQQRKGKKAAVNNSRTRAEKAKAQ